MESENYSARQPHTIRKINAAFENYWNSNDFSSYSADDREQLALALKAEKYHTDTSDYSFDIRPFSYQQEILDRLNAERTIRNYYKNLVVAATGTGKTVISAFVYSSPHEPSSLFESGFMGALLYHTLQINSCFQIFKYSFCLLSERIFFFQSDYIADTIFP